MRPASKRTRGRWCTREFRAVAAAPNSMRAVVRSGETSATSWGFPGRSPHVGRAWTRRQSRPSNSASNRARVGRIAPSLIPALRSGPAPAACRQAPGRSRPRPASSACRPASTGTPRSRRNGCRHRAGNDHRARSSPEATATMRSTGQSRGSRTTTAPASTVTDADGTGAGPSMRGATGASAPAGGVPVAVAATSGTAAIGLRGVDLLQQGPDAGAGKHGTVSVSTIFDGGVFRLFDGRCGTGCRSAPCEVSTGHRCRSMSFQSCRNLIVIGT